MGADRIHRLLRLITALQGGVRCSADELAARVRVSRRTLFRDLNTLKAAGIPCEHSRHDGYVIAPGFFLPPVNLKVTEALGLTLLAKNAQAHPGQPLADAAVEAVEKLTAMMPPPIRDICGHIRRRTTVRPHSVAFVNRDADCHVRLQKAIHEQRVVRMTYHSLFDGGSIELNLHPYHLHFHTRAWYVIGHSETHKQVRIFKLSRIRSLEPTRRVFTLRRPFDVDRFFGKAWGMIPEGKVHRVELLFTAKVGVNVSEVQWHKTQRHELLPDGRCRMTFEVDGLGEIQWWLLGYGDQVRVVRPAALRKRLMQTYAAALRQYEKDAPCEP